LITDHFGPYFSEAVLRLPVNPDLWQGPVVSHHGVHLVLISAVTPKRVLAFSEVRQKIVTEMRLAEQRLRSLAFVDGLLAEFVVQIDPSLGVAQ
jgi:parvulin-like peptidyl-prolyl isomerase